MSDEHSIPVAVWAHDDLLPTLERLLEGNRVDLVGVGGDGVGVRSMTSGSATPLLDDPRLLAAVPEAEAVVLMDPDRPLDPEALSAVMAAAGDRPVLSMTPRPGGPAELMDDGSPLGTVTTLPTPAPCFRCTKAGRRTLAAAENFDALVAASVEFSGSASRGVLATRLLDAFDLLSVWFGMARTVHAIGPRSIASPDTPPARLFVQVAYPDGRAASVSVGVDGGRACRNVVLHGQGGCLRVMDGVVDWTAVGGETVESEPAASGRAADVSTELLESIEAAVAGRLPRRPPEVVLDLLSACEAAMLSLRTGEPETIERVRGLYGRV